MNIDIANTGRSKHGEQEAPRGSADNTECPIDNEGVALLTNDLAGNEAGRKTEDDPADDRYGKGSFNYTEQWRTEKWRMEN